MCNCDMYSEAVAYRVIASVLSYGLDKTNEYKEGVTNEAE